MIQNKNIQNSFKRASTIIPAASGFRCKPLMLQIVILISVYAGPVISFIGKISGIETKQTHLRGCFKVAIELIEYPQKHPTLIR
jgi:hypothetical protein